MSRVFVVQNQHRMGLNGLVPKFDLSPAEEFGELVPLLSETARPFGNNRGIIDELRRKLESYSDRDHLLLIGNPILIGFAVAIAANSNHGRVSLLQWSGVHRRYIQVQAEVFNGKGAKNGSDRECVR